MATPKIERVYTDLRNQIVHGELPSDVYLNLNELRQQFGVSLSVVREAATRLAAQGLLEAVSNKGFRVPPLDIADLTDLTRVRVEIESLCLRSAIKHGGTEWEAELVAAHHRLKSFTPSPEADSEQDRARIACHADFHEQLVAACDSPRLRAIRRRYFDEAERYRQWTRSRACTGRDSMREHTEIMAATLERDQDAAVALLVRHIRLTTEELLATVGQDVVGTTGDRA